MHILILGSGSVGKRHGENLSKLGCEISMMDPRIDRLQEAQQQFAVRNSFTSLEQALQSGKLFNGAVVCSPPSFHIEQAKLLMDAGLPVLMEKPLAPSLADCQILADHNHSLESTAPLLLGYTYRWWEPLKEFKRLIEDNAVGDIHFVNCVMSAHLADWHPWENYWDFFMAKKSEGGGALLDESHFVDLMLWMFGKPQSLYGTVEKLSDLKIDTDDNVDILMRYPNNLRVSIHLDLFGRPHEKYIRVIGSEGSLHWSFDPNEIKVLKSLDEGWKSKTFDYERNDMFVSVAKEFLDVINGEKPSCGLQDGLSVMQTIEAVRESQKTGRSIQLV